MTPVPKPTRFPAALWRRFEAFSMWYCGLDRLARKPAHSPIQPFRLLVQLAFLAITINIGWRFAIFVGSLAGDGPVLPRPAGVEAWLPISSLISLKYLAATGIWNDIHPAGLALFLIILATALLLKRAFCSWVCPIGLLEEFLARLGLAAFRRKIIVPPWLDFPLRSIKYLLLVFFAFSVWGMSVERLRGFIESPYNKVADIKMMKFFMHISPTAAAVLAALVILSFLVPYFWCRYLCPYGALLGLAGVVSPLTVKRSADTCISCQACTKVCPAAITVHRLESVETDECHACLKCADACPVPLTLLLSGPQKKPRPVNKYAFAALVVLFFVVGVAAASLSGKWRTSIPPEEYRTHYSQMSGPEYTHSAAMESRSDS